MKYYYPLGEELKPVVQQDRTPQSEGQVIDCIK